MKLGNQIVGLAICCLFFSAGSFAAKISGTVTNGTSNRPSAGDDVVLLSLAGGMQETARTQTDGKGEFSLDVPDEGVQHLIRVTHQRVNYFHPVPQGTSDAEVTVYDSAKKIDSLIGEGRVFRVQKADRQQIEISEMYIVRNESRPPRTWMGDRTFELVLPEGAQLQEGMAAGPGGMPVTSAPVPVGVKNRYAFVFPIRPGRSQLQVTYTLSYNGSHDFVASPDIPLAEFGVMLPKGMRFIPTGESFSPASDESGMTVFVAKSISPGQELKFSIAGEGMASRGSQGGMGGTEAASAPGGGLGAPIGAPDPLNSARWYVVGTLVVLMAGGAVWMVKRKGVASGLPAAGGAAGSYSPHSSPAVPAARTPAAPMVQGSLLDLIKEELFQLETERLQGKIPLQEYEDAKRGLDALLRRQMSKT